MSIGKLINKTMFLKINLYSLKYIPVQPNVPNIIRILFRSMWSILYQDKYCRCRELIFANRGYTVYFSAMVTVSF